MPDTLNPRDTNTNTDTATSTLTSSSSALTATRPASGDVIVPTPISAPRTIYRVLVNAMEAVQEQRRRDPHARISEPVELVHALVAHDRTKTEQAFLEQSKRAADIEYQRIPFHFQRCIAQTLEETLTELYGQSPSSQPQLADIQHAYQESLEKARIDCVITMIAKLSERQTFTWQERVYTLCANELRQAHQVLDETPAQFDINTVSEALRVYLTQLVYPPLNEALAMFHVTPTSPEQGQTQLAHCHAIIEQAMQADEPLALEQEALATASAVIDATYQARKMARRDRLSERQNHLPPELGIHPSQGYRLKEQQQPRLWSKHARNVNQQDAYGNTLLHHAIALQNFEVAYALIQLEADTTVKNHAGKTAAQMSVYPEKVNELLSRFQEQQGRTHSPLMEKTAHMIQRQKARNEKISRRMAVHSQSLLKSRQDTTQKIEQALLQAEHQFHDDNLVTQLKTCYQETQKSWAGRSVLRKRLGDLIKSVEAGKTAKVTMNDYGRPTSLALPPDTLASGTEITTLVGDNQQLRTQLDHANESSQTLQERNHQLEQERDHAVGRSEQIDQELTVERERNEILSLANGKLQQERDSAIHDRESFAQQLEALTQSVALLMAERAQRQATSEIKPQSQHSELSPERSPGFFG